MQRLISIIIIQQLFILSGLREDQKPKFVLTLAALTNGSIYCVCGGGGVFFFVAVGVSNLGGGKIYMSLVQLC